MKLIKNEKNQYVFVCSYEERFTAKSAGFSWNRDGRYWFSINARQAIKLAAYADDDLRVELGVQAQSLPDPERAELRLEGTVWKYYSPMPLNFPAKDAGFKIKKTPVWHWWTEDIGAALRCFKLAIEFGEDFVCRDREQDILQEEQEKRLQAVQGSRASDAQIDIPMPPKVVLRPFQRAGIAYSRDALTRIGGVLIGDEQGLGKTIQVIGLINSDLSIKTALIIVQSSLKINWYREFEKFCSRELTVGIATAQYLPLDRDVVIINYDIVKRHLARLIARSWNLVCCDEIQYIKNEKAQRSQATTALLDATKRRIGLSGTPLLNRTAEMWNIISHLDPATWPEKKKWPFLIRYAGAKRGPFGWDVSGSSNLRELQEILRSTIMIRRLKSEVLQELPAKTRQIIELPADKSIVTVEQERWAAHKARIEEMQARVELAKAADNQAEYAECVKALASGQLVAFEEISKVRHETALAKLDLCIEHIKQCGESIPKIVIWAHHKDVIEKIMSALGHSAVALTGSMSQNQRQNSVDRFQNDPGVKYFIGSIMAAGVGITLTAADFEIFVEFTFRPSDINQCEDRCHRIGQKNAVFIQHLVLEGSLDAQMLPTLVAKQEIADSMLDREFKVAEIRDAYLPNESEIALPEKAPTSIDLFEAPGTIDFSPAAVAAKAALLSEDDVILIHNALRTLAGMCDGAFARDNRGFSGIDARIGHSLAAASFLTQKQAALGIGLCRKYNNSQLGGMLNKFYDNK